MNVRTATLLSIAGVVAAGTAAVAVNTQVLSGSDASAESSALAIPVATQVYTVPGAATPEGALVVVDSNWPMLPQQTPIPVTSLSSTLGSSDPTIPSSVTGSSSSLGSSDPALPSSPESGGATTAMSFQIGDAAVATVDTANGVLRLIEVKPATGWTVRQTEGSGTIRVEIVLTSSTTSVKFGALLSGGEILTSISSEATSSGSSGSGHHDDEDDEDEDEDHEEDHDEDHDRGDDDD